MAISEAVGLIGDTRPLFSWRKGSQKISLCPLVEGVLHLALSARCFEIESKRLDVATASGAAYAFWEAARAMLGNVREGNVCDTAYRLLWQKQGSPSSHSDYGRHAFHETEEVTSTPEQRVEVLDHLLREHFPQFYELYGIAKPYHELLSGCALWSLALEVSAPPQSTTLFQGIEDSVQNKIYHRLWVIKGKPDHPDFGNHAFNHLHGCSSTAKEKYDAVFYTLKSLAPSRFTLVKQPAFHFADIVATESDFDDQKREWVNNNLMVHWNLETQTFFTEKLVHQGFQHTHAPFVISLCCSQLDGKRVWHIFDREERSVDLDRSAQDNVEGANHPVANFFLSKNVYECVIQYARSFNEATFAQNIETLEGSYNKSLSSEDSEGLKEHIKKVLYRKIFAGGSRAVAGSDGYFERVNTRLLGAGGRLQFEAVSNPGFEQKILHYLLGYVGYLREQCTEEGFGIVLLGFIRSLEKYVIETWREDGSFDNLIRNILEDYLFLFNPLSRRVDLHHYKVQSEIDSSQSVLNSRWTISLGVNHAACTSDVVGVGHAMLLIETVKKQEHKIWRWHVVKHKLRAGTGNVKKGGIQHFEPSMLTAKKTWSVPSKLIKAVFPDSLDGKTVDFSLFRIGGDNCLSWAVGMLKALKLNLREVRMTDTPRSFVESLTAK